MRCSSSRAIPRRGFCSDAIGNTTSKSLIAARAVAAYRNALSLDPHSATTGSILPRLTSPKATPRPARDAFQQAKRVYPISAEVAWRYGNFLLRQNEIPAAFAEIRQSVAVDPKRAAEAVSRSYRLDPDINSIIENVLPPARADLSRCDS